MARSYIPNAAARRHELAELSIQPARQRLRDALVALRPARLREIAAARRTDAQQRAYWLERRGGEEDYHARWVRSEIKRLLEEADKNERDADELEAAHAAP